MNTIDFSYNWNNKLLSKAFTTIRLKNDHKYKTGETYTIAHVAYGNLGPAKIVAMMHFKLSALTETMARIDTGYDLEECKKIILRMYQNKNLDYSTQLFSFITLAYIRKHKAVVIPDDFIVKEELPTTQS